jgi:sugar phosphate isomerase/epimerase
MRLRHPDGQLVHLGYCTNVHPAEDLAGILAQLDAYAAGARRRLDGAVVGLGLWLAAPVAAALADAPASRRRLRRELDARGFEVVTVTGFPYRPFGESQPMQLVGIGPSQRSSAKYAGYEPDWTSRDRLEYTLNLARVLADLLPDDAARGSVSTLPLGWREDWDAAAAATAGRLLDELAEGLTEVAWRTGRLIRVGFEPAPGCVAETAEQAVDALRGVDTDRIGICLDLSHLAGTWEEPAQALATLARAGLPVVKVQVSAALEVADPAAAGPALRRYAEPRRLCAGADGRQIRSRSGAGTDDLDGALEQELPGPWRVHHHLPVHAQLAPPLGTTIGVVRAAFDELVGGGTAGCDHFDVETYGWQGSGGWGPGSSPVLPDPPRTDDELAADLAAELAFVRDEMTARGLTPVDSGVRR